MMISLKESAINKTSKYKVRRDIDDSLSFETDGGVVFRVGFVEDNTLGIPDVYQFYILNVLNVKSHNDSNVRMTISSILEIFFLNRDCVLLYICDSSDGRQRLRNRLFGNWYGLYSGELMLDRFSETIDVEGTDYFMSIVLRKDSCRYDEVVGTFNSFVSDLKVKIEV